MKRDRRVCGYKLACYTQSTLAEIGKVSPKTVKTSFRMNMAVFNSIVCGYSVAHITVVLLLPKCIFILYTDTDISINTNATLFHLFT